MPVVIRLIGYEREHIPAPCKSRKERVPPRFSDGYNFQGRGARRAH
jgi:hypothetical protein